MKRIISAIIAVMLAMGSTSVFAATSEGTLGVSSRNEIAAFTTEATSTNEMPGFRAGDIIKFDVSNLTEENYLTVVSYKLERELGNDTIQYINQYTIDAESRTIEYAIRENTEEGIYKLSLNGNDNAGIINFYYKVGNPEVTMIVGDNTDYRVIESYESNGVTKYAIGFVAKAVIGSNDVSVADVGIKALGFKFTANGKEVTHSLTEEQFDAITTAQKYAETDGGVAFVYGVTIYGMTDMDQVDGIDADVHVVE